MFIPGSQDPRSVTNKKQKPHQDPRSETQTFIPGAQDPTRIHVKNQNPKLNRSRPQVEDSARRTYSLQGLQDPRSENSKKLQPHQDPMSETQACIPGAQDPTRINVKDQNPKSWTDQDPRSEPVHSEHALFQELQDPSLKPIEQQVLTLLHLHNATIQVL